MAQVNLHASGKESLSSGMMKMAAFLDLLDLAHLVESCAMERSSV